MWIDTHCHLDFNPLKTNISSVINEARKNRVDAIIIPSVDLGNISRVIELSDRYRECYYALGFHPMFLEKIDPHDLEILNKYIIKYNPVAIGEIGLDLFVRKDNLEVQEYYFSNQLQLAQTFNLPVIMHVRSAIDLVLKHLRRVKVRGGIVHAFNGSFQQAQQLINLGFKLGFGGAMTNPRATHLQNLAKSLPIESIVLETDAPDMPPYWLQDGAYNQPSEIARIGHFFSDLRGLNSLEFADIIRVNTMQALPRLAKLCT